MPHWAFIKFNISPFKMKTHFLFYNFDPKNKYKTQFSTCATIEFSCARLEKSCEVGITGQLILLIEI